jgi:hypothetical protein
MRCAHFSLPRAEALACGFESEWDRHQLRAVEIRLSGLAVCGPPEVLPAGPARTGRSCGPDTKLVLVQTALSSDDFLTLELATLWAAARAQLR